MSIDVTWGLDWDTDRIERYLKRDDQRVIGFKGYTMWIPAHRLNKALRQGTPIERGMRDAYWRRRSGGEPLLAMPCTSTAVHVACYPDFDQIAAQETLWVAVMRSHGVHNSPNMDEGRKWYGKSYRVVAYLELDKAARFYTRTGLLRKVGIWE